MTPSQQIAADIAVFVDWLSTLKDEDQRTKVALLVRDLIKKAKAS